MSKSKFTPEQLQILLQNPSTKSATENQIRFTKEFKDGLLTAMLNGTTPEEYFSQKGYDPAVIGLRRMQNVVHSVRKAKADQDHMTPDERQETAERKIKVLEYKLEALKKIYLARTGKPYED